jgi:hypothetical protein
VEENELNQSSPASLEQPKERPFWPSLDRRLWLAILVAAAVVLPRSYLIAQAHSESIDDLYHLKRGLVFLTRGLAESELELNDPPLGEGIVALPMLVTNLILPFRWPLPKTSPVRLSREL